MKTYKEFMNEKFVDFDDKVNQEVSFPKEMIRMVARLTDENDHIQARIIIADLLKSVGNRAGNGYIRNYTSFMKMQEKNGYLSQSAVKSMSNADKGLKQELQRTFTNWKAVWRAL